MSETIFSEQQLYKIILNSYVKILKERDLHLFEKFFTYVSVYYNSVDELLFNDSVCKVSVSKPLSVCTSKYNEILKSYKDGLVGSPLEADLRNLVTSCSSMINGINRYKYRYLDDLKLTKWPKMMEEQFKLFPLLKPPGAPKDPDIWAAGSPIGFMARGLFNGNFIFDHESFYKVLIKALKNFTDPESTIQHWIDNDFPEEGISEVTEILDVYINEWFNAASTEGLTFLDKIAYNSLSEMQKISFASLVENNTNREVMALEFLTNFSSIKNMVIIEEVLPKIVRRFERTENFVLISRLNEVSENMLITYSSMLKYANDILEGIHL